MDVNGVIGHILVNWPAIHLIRAHLIIRTAKTLYLVENVELNLIAHGAQHQESVWMLELSTTDHSCVTQQIVAQDVCDVGGHTKTKMPVGVLIHVLRKVQTVVIIQHAVIVEPNQTAHGVQYQNNVWTLQLLTIDHSLVIRKKVAQAV